MNPASALGAGLRRVPVRMAVLAAAGALAFALPSVASAGVDWSVSVKGSASDAEIPAPPNFAECYGDPSSGETSVACGASFGGAKVSGSASAVATYGHLGVSTSSVASTSSLRGDAHASSYAIAQFSDTLQINNPTASGWGTLTFGLYLGRTAALSAHVGDVYSTSAGSADVLASFVSSYVNHSLGQSDGMNAQSTPDGVVEQTGSTGHIDGGSVPSGAALGFHVFSTQFLFNQPFNISLELTGHSGAAGGSTGASGNSFLEAMHSLDWAGIKQVSVDGRAVDYTLWSESGTDWNKSFAPVPEPESWALMLAGFAVVTTVARQRARS